MVVVDVVVVEMVVVDEVDDVDNIFIVDCSNSFCSLDLQSSPGSP